MLTKKHFKEIAYIIAISSQATTTKARFEEVLTNKLMGFLKENNPRFNHDTFKLFIKKVKEGY